MGGPNAQILKFSFGGGFAGGRKVQTRDPGLIPWLTQISSMVQPEMGPPRDPV